MTEPEVGDDSAVTSMWPIHEARRARISAEDRWTEVLRASHDGVALLDEHHRFRAVGNRLGEVFRLGADEVIGRCADEFYDELPDLDVELETASVDRPVQYEHRVTGADGEFRFFQVLLVPRPAQSDGVPTPGSILVQRDITHVRRLQFERRRTQKRILVLEEDENRRVTRDIHDGPIQLLTVLGLRLGLMAQSSDESDELHQLEQSITSAGEELRSILNEFTPRYSRLAPESLFEITKQLLAGSKIDLHFQDLTTKLPSVATLEAMYVFAHEAATAAAMIPVERVVQMWIENVDDDYQLVFHTKNSQRNWIEQDTQPAQVALAHALAQSLGGSFEVGWSDPDIRTVTFRIPELDEDGRPPVDPRRTILRDTIKTRPTPATEEVLAELTPTDADWETVARISHQGLMEVDDHIRVTFVNDAYVAAMKRPASELIGLHLSEVFSPDDFARLRPFVARVMAGEAIRFDWRRRNAIGEQRWTQVAASPRTDSAGRFQGALLVTLDTTDVHTIDELQDNARSQLRHVRSEVEQRIIERLEHGPLQQLERVANQLSALGSAAALDEPVVAIRDALVMSIADLRGSLQLRTSPNLADTTWPEATRASLSSILSTTDADVVVVDNIGADLPLAVGNVLVRIAREAVANALIHANPTRVSVTLESVAGGFQLDVRDDGSGVIPEDAEEASGHLGLRSMRERAIEQHGTFTIGPAVGGGTVVQVWIPPAPPDTIESDAR